MKQGYVTKQSNVETCLNNFEHVIDRVLFLFILEESYA